MQNYYIQRYGSTSSLFQWQSRTGCSPPTTEQNAYEVHNTHSQTFLHRPLGLTETAFHNDGKLFEGRADVAGVLRLSMRMPRSVQDTSDGQGVGKDRRIEGPLFERILNAWTRLRVGYGLLRARAVQGEALLGSGTPGSELMHFVVNVPQNVDELRTEAMQTLILVEREDANSGGDIDDAGFLRHLLNTGRVINVETEMAKLFVLPAQSQGARSDVNDLTIVLCVAHEVTDGLSMLHWMSYFMRLLNGEKPHHNLEDHLHEEVVRTNLPLAQETLYPPPGSSLARQRWFWALTIVLRHVRKPLPVALANALESEKPRSVGAAQRMPSTYPKVLDYRTTPPINTFFAESKLSETATRRLHQICRETGVSIGSGTFAFAALIMMELDVERHPSVSDQQRKPCIVSFPLNPRAMFAYDRPPSSLILAFSQGIVLPFVPVNLPFEGRLKLLARQAHRQLRAYQKRAAKSLTDEAEKNPTRLLGSNFLMAIDRSGIGPGNEKPHSQFPPRPNPTLATHGISSVGSYKWPLVSNAYDVQKGAADDYAFDFVGLWQAVRARDHEFLVVMGGTEKGLWVQVSFDGSTLDEARLPAWKLKIETLLEPRTEADATGRLSHL